MTVDLKVFAQSLFDTMVASVNMGISPPMTFSLMTNGHIEIETLPEKAAHLLSIGRAKDALFGYWRVRCADDSVAAFACGSEVWGFTPNEAGFELHEKDPDKFKSMLDHGFLKLVAAGYGEQSESFNVTAMTRDKVIVMSRRFTRVSGVITWTAEPGYSEMPQSTFRGRMKMWGDLREENLC